MSDPVREAVEQWVTNIPRPDGFGGYHELFVAGVKINTGTADVLESEYAIALRSALTARINDLIREVCLRPVPESPVGADRLAEIRIHAQGFKYETIHREAVRDLVVHIDHLERFIAFLMNTPEGQAYAQGYDEGKRSKE